MNGSLIDSQAFLQQIKQVQITIVFATFLSNVIQQLKSILCKTFTAQIHPTQIIMHIYAEYT